MSEGTQRRLAAILAADVVGYSRLMGEDEGNTIAALRKWRIEMFEPAISSNKGTVVKNMGDGWLVEFDSAGDAVICAIQVQEKLSDHEILKLRIGLHIGDITHADDDIYGDGVNIAARLQEIAEPGAIVMSDVTRRSIDGKLATAFCDLGRQELKNIAEPVAAFGWGMTAVQAAAALLPLPDKPSIAVLPFDNMSGDPEQEYFADGMTEDIITALSKFRWFFVTARNSTFTYKGVAIDIKQVGRELGVRYVLEGSVRKAGKRIRVTAQLIEAETGNHIWAERYDRELDDIFELQDEITRTIAAAVEPELFNSERHRALHKPTDDLGAWSLFQRGVAQLWRMDRANIEASADLIRQAVKLDPEFGQANGYLALTSYLLLIYGWADDRDATLDQGIANAKHAISLDHRDSNAHCVLGRLSTVAGDHTTAMRALETALDYNPSFAHGYYGLGVAYVYKGEPDKALENLDMAMRLSPNDPLTWIFCAYKGLAYFASNDLPGSIEMLERSCQYPSAQFLPFVWLASMYVQTGREKDARRTLATAKEREPNLSIAYLQNMYRNTQGRRAQKLFETLREIGLPEQ